MNAKSIPELKGGQMLTLLYVAAFFIALFVVYKILGAVGIVKTRAARKEEKAEKESSSMLRDADYFNPLFLKDKMNGYKQLGSIASGYAESIHKAVKGIGTNEELIFTTFGRMGSKYNIAETALRYKAMFNSDMLTDILNDLNEGEIVTLWNIVKKLPEK